MYVSYAFASDTTYSIAIAFDGSYNVGTQPDTADFAVYIRDDTAGGAWSEALAYTADSDTWDATDPSLDMSGQDLVLMSPTTSWNGPDYGTLHELGFWNSKLTQSQLPESSSSLNAPSLPDPVYSYINPNSHPDSSTATVAGSDLGGFHGAFDQNQGIYMRFTLGSEANYNNIFVLNYTSPTPSTSAFPHIHAAHYLDYFRFRILFISDGHAGDGYARFYAPAAFVPDTEYEVYITWAAMSNTDTTAPDPGDFTFGVRPVGGTWTETAMTLESGTDTMEAFTGSGNSSEYMSLGSSSSLGINTNGTYTGAGTMHEFRLYNALITADSAPGVGSYVPLFSSYETHEVREPWLLRVRTMQRPVEWVRSVESVVARYDCHDIRDQACPRRSRLQRPPISSAFPVGVRGSCGAHLHLRHACVQPLICVVEGEWRPGKVTLTLDMDDTLGLDAHSGTAFDIALTFDPTRITDKERIPMFQWERKLITHCRCGSKRGLEIGRCTIQPANGACMTPGTTPTLSASIG